MKKSLLIILAAAAIYATAQPAQPRPKPKDEYKPPAIVDSNHRKRVKKND